MSEIKQNNNNSTIKRPCQTCKKTTTNSDNFPFCGERCKLIDLGEWASHGYKVIENKTTTDHNF